MHQSSDQYASLDEVMADKSLMKNFKTFINDNDIEGYVDGEEDLEIAKEKLSKEDKDNIFLKNAFSVIERQIDKTQLEMFETENDVIKRMILGEFALCFHGRTGYTMSLTDSPDKRKTMYFPKFDWPRVTNPKITFPLKDNLEHVQELERKSLHEIKEAIAANPDNIASIILEPIQGEGGDNHFRCEFMQSLREIADENDIMLIYDEVQTGVGVTGKMWAHQHFSATECATCDCEDGLAAKPG